MPLASDHVPTRHDCGSHLLARGAEPILNLFHCDSCRHLVFFENTRCVQCGHVLAYLPDVGQMASIEPDRDGSFLSPSGRSPATGYRLCRNYTEHSVCNWAI